MQYFVAGMRSDSNFLRRLSYVIGIQNTTVSHEKEAIKLKRKESKSM